jgi:hypothetical protein
MHTPQLCTPKELADGTYSLDDLVDMLIAIREYEDAQEDAVREAREGQR